MPPAGGGLVILPKKSWNVWNHDNRERVRRDEAAAKKEESEKRARADAADQEARLDVMRRRAAARHSPIAGPADEEAMQALEHIDPDGPTSPPLSPSQAYPPLGRGAPHGNEHGPPQHVNLFEDVERRQLKGGSKSRAKERQREEEEALKKVGALVYLGQSVSDAGGGPWYARRPGDAAAVGESRRPSKRRHTAEAGHSAADPAAMMQAFVKAKKMRQRGSDHANPSLQSVGNLRQERERREQRARVQVSALLRSPEDATHQDFNPLTYSQSYSHYHNTMPSHPTQGETSSLEPSTSSKRKHDRREKKKSKKEKKAKKEKKKKSRRDRSSTRS
eukprot:m.30029 g.30029  ORF g.30029 m.30029 type:complete len:333 (+) comp4657_c0_seq1:82-1080(+)